MDSDLAPVTDRQAWEALVRRTGPGQVQQSWAYGAALAARGAAVERLRLVEAGGDVGVVQLVGRRLLGGPVVLWHGLGGPAWLTACPQGGIDALRRLRRRYGWRRGAVLLLTPAAADPEADRRRLRAAGYRQAMTGYTTARLELGAGGPALHRGLTPDWRRLLRRGPDPALALSWQDPRTAPWQLDDLLAHDAAQGRARGYASLPGRVVAATARNGGGLLATATLGGELVAAMLLLRHGATAIYQTGWSDPRGRERYAHHHLLWGAIERLAGDRVAWLDLGGLNVPPGVARFKLATGARPTTFAGTFA